MKFKLKGIIIELKYLLLISIIISIFSINVRNYLKVYYECYLFIIFHEFSHIMIASIFGCKLKKIEFSICGMSANIDITKKKKKNILIFLAGPIANLVLAVIFINNSFIFKTNIILGIINLIPLYPLDGYRVLKEYNINLKNAESFIYFVIIIFGLIFKNLSVIVFGIYIILLKINIKKY